MKQPDHPDLARVTLPRALKALGDPVRLGIVATLSDGAERSWSDFQVNVAKSTLSQHMKVLREAGVTQTRIDGTRCYVSLRREFDVRFPDLISTVIALHHAQHG